MKPHLPTFFLFTLILFSACSGSKKNTSAPVALTSGAAIIPNTFQCIGTIKNISAEDTLGCIYYSFILSNVLARGSSLVYQPAKGDTLLLKDCIGFHKKNFLLKNDNVKASVEERLKLNQQMPEFILRDITNLEKH